MAQPQKYERQHDFEGDDADAINCTALNREFDNAAQTISQLRARQAKILRDDDTLSAGIVGVESLTEEATDFLTRSVDKKSEAALVAASEAGDSAEKAASITPESYTTVEVFNSFMTSIYEACDEFIKGV